MRVKQRRKEVVKGRVLVADYEAGFGIKVGRVVVSKTFDGWRSDWIEGVWPSGRKAVEAVVVDIRRKEAEAHYYSNEGYYDDEDYW